MFIKKSSRMNFSIFWCFLSPFIFRYKFVYTRFPIRSGHCHVYNSYALQTIERVRMLALTHFNRIPHICILPQSPSSLAILIFMSCIHNMVVMTVESGFLFSHAYPLYQTFSSTFIYDVCYMIIWAMFATKIQYYSIYI